MAHYYYVWKDPTCGGINPQWKQMSGRKFYDFLQNEGKDRYFITIDDGADQGMDVITMEATYEKYVEWHKEHQAAYRFRKQQEKYKPVFVSIDTVVDEQEDMTFHEILADESVDVEAAVFDSILKERLYEALGKLSPEEARLITAVYFPGPKKKNERQLAEDFKMSKSSFNREKQRILKKLKKILGQK